MTSTRAVMGRGLGGPAGHQISKAQPPAPVGRAQAKPARRARNPNPGTEGGEGTGGKASALLQGETGGDAQGCITSAVCVTTAVPATAAPTRDPATAPTRAQPPGAGLPAATVLACHHAIAPAQPPAWQATPHTARAHRLPRLPLRCLPATARSMRTPPVDDFEVSTYDVEPAGRTRRRRAHIEAAIAVRGGAGTAGRQRLRRRLDPGRPRRPMRSRPVRCAAADRASHRWWSGPGVSGEIPPATLRCRRRSRSCPPDRP